MNRYIDFYYFCDQHETMESLMQRGEKIDDLVAKSDQLSDQSKTFYKQVINFFKYFSRKFNCCKYTFKEIFF